MWSWSEVLWNSFIHTYSLYYLAFLGASLAGLGPLRIPDGPRSTRALIVTLYVALAVCAWILWATVLVLQNESIGRMLAAGHKL